MIVDCRADETRGRNRSTVELPPLPFGMLFHKIPSTDLSYKLDEWKLRESYQPVIDHLAAGGRVLIHCVNGKHRSSQTCCCMISPFFESPQDAMDWVWSLRGLTQFSSLPGSLYG